MTFTNKIIGKIMVKVTLIGGSLGAGKTTLLSNLVRNNSFSYKDGIIVMDAAGDIDYSRVSSEATKKGITIANATSACTVCDGPESAFRQLDQMKNLEHVVIELSGQMPLPVMQGRLSAKGANLHHSIYLVDPRNFSLVQAPDEVPFASVVGLTKNPEMPDISKYNPQAKVVRIGLNQNYTLDELTREAPSVESLSPTEIKSSHAHPPKGMLSKWAHKVYNPYHSVDGLRDILQPLSEEYDRLKGYVALDSSDLFSFDCVLGEFNYEIRADDSLGNGTLLLVNTNNRFFSESQAREDTRPLTEKPDVPPVLRRGSSKESFERYINQALLARQYDDAMGSSEQYRFESNDESLFLQTLPRFAKGKLEIIQGGNLSRSQRLRQGMSALYSLIQSPNSVPANLLRDISSQYTRDFGEMIDSDWNEINALPDSGEIIRYINQIREKIK